MELISCLWQTNRYYVLKVIKLKGLTSVQPEINPREFNYLVKFFSSLT